MSRTSDDPADASVATEDLAATIDRLVAGPQFDTSQADKERRLLPILSRLCGEVAAGCPAYDRFLRRLGTPAAEWSTLADIPALPVSMFKRFELRAVAREQIVRELHSSATTGSSPSRILIDKPTAFRQARALVSILKEAIGGERRPYLVIDAEEASQSGATLTARGAAIRGLGSFARSTTFALRSDATADLEPDWDRVRAFFDELDGAEALVFGFTYIVWMRFVEAAEQAGIRFSGSGVTLLHSGGWKKLQAQAVSKTAFNERTAAVLGTDPDRILDFYGMVEQVGTVFVDCSAGRKHAPAFADVLIRRPLTLEPVDIGEEGVIEVLSVLPTSYPGQALLTEDQGRLIGIDDCPCGRAGRTFVFTRRVERTEVRGCGDTFAQRQGR